MKLTENFPKILFRAICVWLVIIGAEILHGILRTLFLEPLTGDFRARQIAVFTGAIIILTIAYLFVERLHTSNYLQLFAVGILWFVLTISFEIFLGRFVLNMSWERIASDYNLLQGGLLLIGLLILILSPLIAAEARRFFAKDV